MKQYYPNNSIFIINLIFRKIKNLKELLVFGNSIKKIFFAFLLFFVQAVVVAQANGDYRSKVTTGNWTDPTSWERWSGSAWIEATPAQGYPGEFTGTGTVLIESGHTISIGTTGITTTPIGTLTINGSLILNGNNNSASSYNISTQNVIVTASGQIGFYNKVNFKLPINSVIQLVAGSEGLKGDCSNNQSIYIDTIEFSVCTGNNGDTNFTFQDLIDNGGTLNSIITTSSTVCQGDGIALSGSMSGPKGTNLSYTWSITDPNNNTSTKIQKNTNIANSISGIYTVTLTCTTSYDGRSFSNDETILVTVNALPAKPIVSVTQPDCTSSKGVIRITPVSGMRYSIDGTNYGNTSGNFPSLNLGSYKVTAKSASGCISSVVAATISPSSKTTTWNSTGWTNLKPTFSMEAIISVDYDTSINGDLDACSLMINSSTTLRIGKNGFVTIQNNLTVQPSSKLNVLDQGSLVMVKESGLVDNRGMITVNKTTSPFEQYDYTYWSSPIVGPAKIATTFPSWNTNYAFAFHPENFIDADGDGYDDNQDDYIYASTLTPGRGYVIMGPTSGIFPRTESVVFAGTVNNGIVTTPIKLTPGNDPEDDFNLVGNPYPSAISADALIKANISGTGTINSVIEGTLYFWTHKADISLSNPGPEAFNFSQDDYAIYTLAGGVGTSASESGGVKPSGYIASGQGFFVEAEAAGFLTFKNSMRVSPSFNSGPPNANSQFYKTMPVKGDVETKDRLWLNLENSDGMFSQQLLGYFENTTNEVDNGYDGLLSDGGNYINFYSLINKAAYKIQGRKPFKDDDQVRLGYFSAIGGTFNINIDSKEGVFNTEDNEVILEDKLLGIMHNLKDSPYSFDTASGTFDDRFVLRYTNKTLATDDFDIVEEGVLVSVKNKQIKIASASELINTVKVFDLLGRLVYEKSKIDGNEWSIPHLVANKQVLLVKTVLQNGQIITDKIIY
ncbi:MAG: hypothetical protein ACI9WT_001656 [Flavobacterium sp.]|jgi:hypothetical protein